MGTEWSADPASDFRSESTEMVGTFIVEDHSTHEIYPGRDIRLRAPNGALVDGALVLRALGYDAVQAGDEVQIKVKLVSRVVTERRKF